MPKLGQLYASREALGELFKTSIPVATAVALKRVLRKVDAELLNFEEIRIELVNKYGKKGDDGAIKVAPENLEKFKKDIDTALDQNVDLGAASLFSIEQFEGAKISVANLSLLEWLIDS